MGNTCAAGEYPLGCTEVPYVTWLKSFSQDVLWLHPTQGCCCRRWLSSHENHISGKNHVNNCWQSAAFTQGKRLQFVVCHTCVTMRLLITSRISAPRGPAVILHEFLMSGSLIAGRHLRRELFFFPGVNFIPVLLVSAPDARKPLCFIPGDVPLFLSPKSQSYNRGLFVSPLTRVPKKKG